MALPLRTQQGHHRGQPGHQRQLGYQGYQQPTPIPYSAAYYARLAALVHHPDTLKMEGYKMEDLGDEDILRLQRCRDCHGSRVFLFGLRRWAWLILSQGG